MRISVSARVLTMPTVCVCCGNPANQSVRATATRIEGKRVVRTKTSEWDFPHCAACAAHDDEWPGMSGAGVVWLTLLTFGIYLYFYLKRRQRALSMCTVACARPRAAVRYIGWSGTVHHFDFHAPRFVREFLIANKSKVVEAEARALGLLNAPPPPAPPPGPAAWPSQLPARVPPASAAPATAWPPPVALPRSQPYSPPAPPALRPPAAAGAVMQFLGKADSAEVAGRILIGPLTYFASGEVPSASAIIATAAVGDPRLAAPLPYWPSYGAASPAQRAVYLDWLAGGRIDPAIPIGYVFIYFYGLEQRVLVDDRDHDVVREELKRLRHLYASEASFVGYAERLLSFMLLPRLTRLGEDELRTELGPASVVTPAATSAVLAWYHIHDRPLPADYAAVVVRSLEGAKRGVAVQRSGRELADLFAIRYREKFDAGLVLQVAKRPELITYRPASATLAMSRQEIRAAIPHVLGRSAQFNPLVAIWNGCIADLKKAATAKRGTADDAALTAAAWEALPPELRAEYDHPAQDAWDGLIQRARRLEQYHLVTAGELVALGGTRPAASVSAVQLRQACETAALLGYAIEPDARVAAKKRPSGTEMLVWRVDDTRPMPATTWRSVHTMLSLMLSVASADGAVGADEVGVVASFIEELFVMDDLMRSRVEALRQLITRSPGKAGAIARTLQTSRTRDELLKIGRVLVAVAGADGVISDNEHASLRTLYKGLGLTAADLSAAMIASGAQLASDMPVSVQPAEAPAPGQPIPQPRPPKGPGLDSKAIAAILAETREVAALLSAVLDTDDDEGAEPTAMGAPVPAPPPSAGAGAEVEGMLATLDVRYQAIVQQLLTKPHWSSAEVRTIATSAKVMPGAIVETVNAWSDDRLGDYLIDESDGWHIRTELLTRGPE